MRNNNLKFAVSKIPKYVQERRQNDFMNSRAMLRPRFNAPVRDAPVEFEGVADPQLSSVAQTLQSYATTASPMNTSHSISDNEA